MVVNIIPTTQAEHIGKKLAKDKGVNVIFPDVNKEKRRQFPDGEIYERISDVKDIRGKAVVLHSGAPDPNEGLVELMMLLNILKQSGTSSREVFFTYFPYGRQDNRFQMGETNFAEDLVRMLTSHLGVRRIYTIDAHFTGRDWISRYPITNFSAAELLMRAASEEHPEIIYIGPDAGAERRTGIVSSRKERIDSYEVRILIGEQLKKYVRGKTVGAVDDSVHTGETFVDFYDECMAAGAKKVVPLATHGVLHSGIQRVMDVFGELYLTNSIDTDRANVDISGIVCKTFAPCKYTV